MPTHKLAVPQGVLHIRMTDVHQPVTKEMLREEFSQFGAGNLLCAFERVVDGMYGVEAYIQFSSRWRAARARDALDGRALYAGCCFLSVAAVPPIYTAISMPDDDEFAPSYFYDDTPYAEWAADLAAVEHHVGESTLAAASASFTSTPEESTDVPDVCVIDKPPSSAEPRATTPAVCVRTAMHEGDDDLTPVAPSNRSSATAPLDSTSIPMVLSHLASEIEPMMPTSCSMECLRDDTIVETPASAPGRYCSDQISMEEPLSCLQCVRLQFCCPPGRAKLSGKLFLFLEGAQVDENSLEYTNHCGSETMQWEIAWALKYEYDFLVLLLPERSQFDSLKICILAWLEHSYVFSELTYYCEPWTSWQIQFFVHGTRIAAPIYALLIELNARDGLEMRLELSMRTDKFASTFCSIILHNMGTCSSLQILERPWFLASCIRPGTPLFIGSYSSLFQLYYTWFGSTTWADQKKYRTDYYIGRIKVPSSLIGAIGNAFICGSSHFQWYIAWSYTLAQAASLITTEALASDPTSVVVRLLAIWISDLIIAKDSFCTTLRTAKQLIGDDISSHQPQCCYMFTTRTFSSSTHCEIIQVNFAIVGIAAWYVFCTRFRPAKVYFLLNDMQYTNKGLFQTLVLAFRRVLVVVVVDSALGFLSLHWGLALWNQPGMHFLLGGAAVHYSAWLFQLSIEFVQLVSTSSLQAVALYWFANYHSQYDCELLQWLIAWSLATENGYAVVMVNYLSPHVWVVLSPNGYVGRTTPYGTEQSEWQLAWSRLFDVLRAFQSTREFCSCILWSRAAVLFFFSMEFQTLKGPMEQWDPAIAVQEKLQEHVTILYELMVRQVLALYTSESGTTTNVLGTGFFMLLHNHKPALTGNGFVYGHGSEQFQWEIAWLIDLDYLAVGNKFTLAMPWDPCLRCLVELIQKRMVSLSLLELQFWTSFGTLLLVPIVLRIALDNCHGTVMLGKVTGEGAPILQYFGSLHKMQIPHHSGSPRLYYCFLHAQTLGICQFLDLSELHWQHSSCKYSMSESFPWYIAWLLMVSSCAGSDSGLSGNFANIWMMFRIIWLLDLVCSASGNKSDQLILPTMGESETYLEKRNALVLPFYTRTVQNSLLVIWFWPYHSEHCACHYPTSGKVEAARVRNAAPTIHVIEQVHAGHDYYFDCACYFDNVHADDNYYYDAFLDRVDHRLGLFNLIQVLVDHGYYRNCDNQERQVQWDPGGSTSHRLEVKPKFKEEGMLATSPAASTALGLGCRYWAWAAGMTRRQRLQISAEAIRPTRLGTGRLRPPLLLSPVLLPPLLLFL